MKVVCLSGGVGGAKLALGLSKVLAPDDLTIIANTGDDFEHLGLPICPDIDTLVYTLSGLANQKLGWGREDESGAFMDVLAQLGGPDWFYLGDRDLAMHHARRALIKEGFSLTEITHRLASAVGVRHRILPMCDLPAPTIVETVDGALSFQDYFVRLRGEPPVTGFDLHGGNRRRASVQVETAVHAADLIIIGPSNPLISIDPILHLEGFVKMLADADAKVIAVSPIVAGDAIKGPTAKMMRELGADVSVTAIAKHYHQVATHLVIDHADSALKAAVRGHIANVSITKTIMKSLNDRIALAKHLLEVA